MWACVSQKSPSGCDLLKSMGSSNTRDTEFFSGQDWWRKRQREGRLTSVAEPWSRKLAYACKLCVSLMSLMLRGRPLDRRCAGAVSPCITRERAST